MSELTLIAIHQVKPEYKQAYQQAAREVVAASQQEQGCISYELTIDSNDDNTFVFIETWASEQAITYHNSTEHFLKFKSFLDNKLNQRIFYKVKKFN